MELKVWVEGIQRIVCGVTGETTCQDVVFALAHATGKTGRFTLIERWRNNSRLLAPQESPLKILTKLGEYSGEVQFILQKSEKSIQHESISSENADSKKSSLDISKKGILMSDNVGIVKGVPQNQQSFDENQSDSNDVNGEILSPEKFTLKNDSPLTASTCKIKSASSSPIALIGTSGSLNPPPYRNPPAPSTKPTFQNNSKLIDSSLSNGGTLTLNSVLASNDDLLQSIQYKDLIQLIKLQREKIINQQNDLTKFDAEIVYLENKGREQIQQFEAIAQELTKTDQMYRQGNEQLQTFQYVEDENELVHQQEKALKTEITLLRSKLGILETELLQCKNKIKKLMNDVQLEQRNFNQQHENQHYIEKKLINEVDRLQADLDYVVHASDSTMKTADTLKKEVLMIEMSIMEKKKQLEKLVHEMKEVNLQSLTVATEDHLPIEGLGKRRMIGSPRQLENAVATSKNPHGVWV